MQQLAFKAYSNVTQRTASDEQIEYALFRDITEALQDVASKDSPPLTQWADAVDRNLQLWTLLSADLMSPDNELDAGLKQGLLTLSESVRRLSYGVLAGNAELDDLIEINESIMTGLQTAASIRKGGVAA